MDITRYMRPEEKARLAAFVAGYLACACWTEEPIDDPDEAVDYFYPDELAPEALARAWADCLVFWQRCAHVIPEGQEEQAGQDFWLTRNGHGAGFWDGDWPEHGEYLTWRSERAGELFGGLYRGGDGKLYFG